MATNKEVAKLKSYIAKLKEYLRDQRVWEVEIQRHVQKLLRRGARVGPPPTVTDPPKPPR